jgi:hypothetical protein
MCFFSNYEYYNDYFYYYYYCFYYFYNFKFNIALIGNFILTATPRCHDHETKKYFCNKEEADLLV